MGTAIQQQRPGIRIDTEHCRAICDEIGWRLRKTLAADYATLPNALAVLLERLIDIDMAIDAPSIVPAMADMHTAPGSLEAADA